MAIDAWTRAAVLMIWGNRCFYCGHDANQVDHIVARQKRGVDAAHNLVAACEDCNRCKKSLWLHPAHLEQALEAAQKLAPSVLALAFRLKTAELAAEHRLKYGSVPLRTGAPGHSMPARDLAAKAAEICHRYDVLTSKSG